MGPPYLFHVAEFWTDPTLARAVGTWGISRRYPLDLRSCVMSTSGEKKKQEVVVREATPDDIVRYYVVRHLNPRDAVFVPIWFVELYPATGFRLGTSNSFSVSNPAHPSRFNEWSLILFSLVGGIWESQRDGQSNPRPCMCHSSH